MVVVEMGTDGPQPRSDFRDEVLDIGSANVRARLEVHELRVVRDRFRDGVEAIAWMGGWSAVQIGRIGIGHWATGSGWPACPWAAPESVHAERIGKPRDPNKHAALTARPIDRGDSL